jgi:hypothetical protein
VASAIAGSGSELQVDIHENILQFSTILVGTLVAFRTGHVSPEPPRLCAGQHQVAPSSIISPALRRAPNTTGVYREVSSTRWRGCGSNRSNRRETIVAPFWHRHPWPTSLLFVEGCGLHRRFAHHLRQWQAGLFRRMVHLWLTEKLLRLPMVCKFQSFRLFCNFCVWLCISVLPPYLSTAGPRKQSRRMREQILEEECEAGTLL